MIYNNIPLLKINKLSTSQYDQANAAGLLEETAIYLTPSDDETIYYIDCYAIIADGVYTDIQLANTGDKTLADILSEAAAAHTKSRLIVLRDLNTGVCLTGLVALKPTTSLIFDVPHENIDVKNIIYLDNNGFTCYHMKLQPELTIDTMLTQNSSNPISSGTVYSAIQDTKTYAENLANGRCKTYIFDDKATLQAWIEILDSETLEELNAGDVFLLRSVGEPDYWWEPEGEIALLVEYSDEDIVVSGKGAARILETTKVDFSILDNYAKKEEDLDGLTLKRVYEYDSSLISAADGYTEYDTTNKKIYIWSGGSRGTAQDPDPNILYIIREV